MKGKREYKSVLSAIAAAKRWDKSCRGRRASVKSKGTQRGTVFIVNYYGPKQCPAKKRKR